SHSIAAGTLHLYNVGAEIRKKASSVCSSKVGAQVPHPKALEGLTGWGRRAPHSLAHISTRGSTSVTTAYRGRCRSGRRRRAESYARPDLTGGPKNRVDEIDQDI